MPHRNESSITVTRSSSRGSRLLVGGNLAETGWDLPLDEFGAEVSGAGPRK